MPRQRAWGGIEFRDLDLRRDIVDLESACARRRNSAAFYRHELQRELYTRLLRDDRATDTLTAIARAGYDTGTTWEHTIAHWLREAGAAPQTAAWKASRAGT